MQVSLRGLAAAVVIGLLAACGGGGGSSGETKGGNAAPRAAAMLSGPVLTEGGQLRGTLGGIIQLDAGASTDADGDRLAFEWTLVSKPAGSTASVSGNERVLSLTPDALGCYAFSLKVMDGRGGVTTQRVTVVVDNRAPSTTVVVRPKFTPVPVQLRAQGVATSTDADGDVITYAWGDRCQARRKRRGLVVFFRLRAHVHRGR